MKGSWHFDFGGCYRFEPGRVSNLSLVRLSRRRDAFKQVRVGSRRLFRKACRSGLSAHCAGIHRHRQTSQTCFEGPFGELLRATGPMAKANPIRFSTQCTDDETDLVCYLHRYYNPSTGRWLSKDPLTEPGFILLAKPAVPRQKQGRPDSNPYRFLHNDAVNETDFLGLWYNIFTHCCCRGQLIPRKPVPSGIRFCDIKSDYGEYDHGWIEIDGFSAGFVAGDSIWGGPGRVEIPDPYADRSYKRCRDILLSPCKYDFKVLKLQIANAIIADQANPGQYNVAVANCYHWRFYMLNHFLATHKGCGDSMGSFE